jgi:Fe-S-cluster containining protein
MLESVAASCDFSCKFFGGSTTPCASPPPWPSIFSDYSFWIHNLANWDDRHLLAHAMASDFSVPWQCLLKRTIGFFVTDQTPCPFLVSLSLKKYALYTWSASFQRFNGHYFSDFYQFSTKKNQFLVTRGFLQLKFAPDLAPGERFMPRGDVSPMGEHSPLRLPARSEHSLFIVRTADRKECLQP